MNLKNIFQKLNWFCAEKSSLIILSGILIGFLSDLFGRVPNYLLSIILFLELFLACFKINFDDVRKIKINKIIFYFIFRFLLLPILMFYLGSIFSNELALALLLLTLLPAGVSSPGFASLLNANVAVTIAIVLLSSILAPFYIPLAIKSIANLSVEIDALHMLTIIAMIIIAPMIIHLPFRKSQKSFDFFANYNSMLLMPLVWITIVVPISRVRVNFLSNLPFYLQATAGFILLYLIFIFFGFFIAKLQKNICYRSYVVTSVIHNITLGVVLSLLYFTKEVSSLVITANISLLLIVTILKPLFKRIN